MAFNYNDKVSPAPPNYQNQYPGVITTQPTAPATHTTVIVNQPMSQQEHWNSELCDCGNDLKSCCCVFWLGAWYYGCISQRMGEHYCVGCSGHAHGGCVPGGHLAMRASFRAKYGIPGSICDDCCVVACCTPCAMCQMAREMTHRGYPGGSC